ncbi:ATP-binding protein [Kitasatospora sp. NPDC049285]|uniref:ATP-binding protein n=1 Tax=Kitasatospora sp. NPDC049285 TaxID=3157096 RepID=UPI003443E056
MTHLAERTPETPSDTCPATAVRVGLFTVTSNLACGRSGETFSADVVAAAMIDRLVRHAHVLTLASDTYRNRRCRELLAHDKRAHHD